MLADEAVGPVAPDQIARVKHERVTGFGSHCQRYPRFALLQRHAGLRGCEDMAA